MNPILLEKLDYEKAYMLLNDINDSNTNEIIETK